MHKLVEMTFGSHLYGTNTPTSDHDYKGVFLPTQREILLQRVPNSINSMSNKTNTKNSASDIDSEFYSIHYFLHLACKGETVALDMLHAPCQHWITASYVWEDLVSQRAKFYTKNLNAFVGYARRQAAKYGVKGTRLAEAKIVLDFLYANAGYTIANVWDRLPKGEHCYQSSNGEQLLYIVCGKKLTMGALCSHYIPMLNTFIYTYGERAKQAEANEGIDWKAISHAFRAAYQVKHILVDGGYTYPLPETEFLIKIKQGALHFKNEVAPLLDNLMDELEQLSKVSTLPEQVDRKYWDTWLYDLLRYP